MANGGVNGKDATGQTPLMLASAIGSLEAVRLLLVAGAEADAVSQLGRTPLLIAASATGTEESVRLLLARGANVDAADPVGSTHNVRTAAGAASGPPGPRSRTETSAARRWPFVL